MERRSRLADKLDFKPFMDFTRPVKASVAKLSRSASRSPQQRAIGCEPPGVAFDTSSQLERWFFLKPPRRAVKLSKSLPKELVSDLIGKVWHGRQFQKGSHPS